MENDTQSIYFLDWLPHAVWLYSENMCVSATLNLRACLSIIMYVIQYTKE